MYKIFTPKFFKIFVIQAEFSYLNESHKTTAGSTVPKVPTSDVMIPGEDDVSSRVLAESRDDTGAATIRNRDKCLEKRC